MSAHRRTATGPDVADSLADALTCAATQVRDEGRGLVYTADQVADLLTALAADFCKAADRLRGDGS